MKISRTTFAGTAKLFSTLLPAAWRHRKSFEKAQPIPISAPTSKELASAKLERANAKFLQAKSHYGQMQGALSLGIAAWHAIFDTNADRALNCAYLAREGYLEVVGLAPPGSPSRTEAEEKIALCCKILAKTAIYQDAKKYLTINAVTALERDSVNTEYSGKALASAKAILAMLAHGNPVADILTEINPAAGFSEAAKAEAMKLLSISKGRPIFDLYIRKIVADYCGHVVSREAPAV